MDGRFPPGQHGNLNANSKSSKVKTIDEDNLLPEIQIVSMPASGPASGAAAKLVPRVPARFVRLKGSFEPAYQLFCFPFAGGSASIFHGWGDLLAPAIAVWTALPRGRGMRFMERPESSIDAMIEDYLPELRRHIDSDLPFAFYGHSLGGLLAFALTLRLEQEGLPAPKRLFIGACPPPSLGLLHPAIHHLPDTDFVNAIQLRYAGIPAAVLQEPELLELLLPSLRGDYAAHETFNRNELRRVSCPLTIFAGLNDSEYSVDHMSSWSLHTAATCRINPVPGDHFFLTTDLHLVLTQMVETLTLQPLSAPAAVTDSEI